MNRNITICWLLGSSRVCPYRDNVTPESTCTSKSPHSYRQLAFPSFLIPDMSFLTPPFFSFLFFRSIGRSFFIICLDKIFLPHERFAFYRIFLSHVYDCKLTSRYIYISVLLVFFSFHIYSISCYFILFYLQPFTTIIFPPYRSSTSSFWFLLFSLSFLFLLILV